MKKMIIAALAASAMSAFAADAEVSYVRDFGVNANGVRVATNVAGFTLSGTNIADQYNRVALGKDVTLVSSGPFSASVGAGVAYQSTLAPANVNGYGVTLGGKVSYQLSKSVALTAGVEQFYGQSRLAGFSNVVGTTGIKVTF